jgi:prepilin-type N-terminal cleavage/methylation domain-containing protein
MTILPNLMIKSRGFTLIEVVIIIVVLGILSVLAVAKYQDLSLDAKQSACRGSLGGLRSGLNTWYAQNIVRDGSAQFPPIDSLRKVGCVMDHRIPPNPYQANAPDSIVTGVTRGVVVSTRGGWAYKAATGELWANTATTIPGSGCSGPTSVGENTW